ncbi:hypothetical protein AAC387_Pa06g2271 [Persea americana]
MHFQASKSFEVLLFSIFLLHFWILVTTEEPIFFHCYDSSLYTSSSPFETILKTAFHSLPSNGVLRRDTFYSATYGDDPNTVYGFSQCMSGASEADCSQCLIDSAVDVAMSCPKRTQASIRYYYCILRYSNRSFLSISDDSVKVWGPTLDDIQIYSTFTDEILALIQNASTSPSRIGSRVTSASNSQKIYALAQCTRDLDENIYYSCLRSTLMSLETTGFGSIYEYIYSLSCNMRYETYRFYNVPESPPAAPTPTSDSAPPTSDNAGKILL